VHPLGDHLCTCTAHSGAKKAHDLAVDQIADLFRTTHIVKTEHVTKSRGRFCGDVKLTVYLSYPVPESLRRETNVDRELHLVLPSLKQHRSVLDISSLRVPDVPPQAELSFRCFADRTTVLRGYIDNRDNVFYELRLDMDHPYEK
jgi:hypothetical protein